MAAIHIIGAICDSKLNVDRSIVAGRVIIEAQGGSYSGVDHVVFSVTDNMGNSGEVTVTGRTPSTYLDTVITAERGRYYFQAPFDFADLLDGWVKVTATLYPKIGIPRTVEWNLLNNSGGTGLAAIGVKEPRTVHVHAELGNDANDGSEASPKKTLHNALESCKWANEGNGGLVILHSDVALLKAQRRVQNKTWLTVQGNGHEIRLDPGHPEAPGFAFRTDYVKLENCVLNMDRVSVVKANIWLDQSVVTDRGAWHMGSNARSVGGEGSWDGKLFTIDCDMFRRAPANGDIWVSTPAGKFDMPFEKVDDRAVMIIDPESIMGPPRTGIDWGRGFRFLQSGTTAYVTNTLFKDINHGPRGAVLVRNCEGIGQISDFMVEPKCVVATKIQVLGYESGSAFHSDAIQAVWGMNNVVQEGLAIEVDNSTQILFDENSSSTIGGPDVGHDDVWRCNILAVMTGTGGPVSQFCRECKDWTLVHSTFVGQKTYARGADDPNEDFHPLPGLIAGNAFHEWMGRKEEWFNNHELGQPAVTLEAVYCEGDLYGNPHVVGGPVGAVASAVAVPEPDPAPEPQHPAIADLKAHYRRDAINILLTAGYSEADAVKAADEFLALA
jgi:hypothetical protein